MEKQNIAIIIAGGTGSRMKSDIPKQFMIIDKKPLIIHTLQVFEKNDNINEVIVVCIKGWKEHLEDLLETYKIKKVKCIVNGGENGQQSAYNGIEKVKERYSIKDDITVIIHDANRPLIDDKIINSLIEVCEKHNCAVSAIPSNEIIMISNDKIGSSKSIDRNILYRIQKPEAYKLKYLTEIYKKAEENNITNAVATCEIVTLLNKKLYFSKGSETNIKLTTPDDLRILEALLKLKGDKYRSSEKTNQI